MKRQYHFSENLDEQTKKMVLKELKLGFLNLSEGYFEQATMNFQLAIAFDENCPDAYWGLMLCKLGARTEDELQNFPMRHKSALSMDECKKAMSLAGDELKKTYQALLENVQKVCMGDEY